MIVYSHRTQGGENMGNKLKKKRKELDMTLNELSEKTGISTTYLSNLENEQKANPTKETMEKISAALGQTVTEIFFME